MEAEINEVITYYKNKYQSLVNYANKILRNVYSKRYYSRQVKYNFYLRALRWLKENKKRLDNEKETKINEIKKKYSQMTSTEHLTIKSVKKACLVGINYNGTTAQLNGCVNDVFKLKKILIEKYGYEENNITLLTEKQATRKNILYSFKHLVETANPGDSICFTFSGHGYYTKDKQFEEADGKDELIVSYDYYAVTDDEFKLIIDTHLKKDVKMFAMFDNCHSGTILDLKYKYENNKNIITNSNYRETKGNVILVSGCKDNQVSYDASINNQFNGVLTWVIINVLENNENITWASLLKKAREIIAMNKFDQIPQLSCGTNVDLDTLNVFI